MSAASRQLNCAFGTFLINTADNEIVFVRRNENRALSKMMKSNKLLKFKIIARLCV